MRIRLPMLVLAICATAAHAADTCPVTAPPKAAFVPPKPYPAWNSQGSFYLGTAKLWVLVHPSPWRGLPKWPEGYREKIVWWSQGYDAKADPTPNISITGRRLDAAASPMLAGANGSWTDHDFIMSGVNFPTQGCWEVTGKFRGSEVKFVVQVEP
jgi:hypothetical protein